MSAAARKTAPPLFRWRAALLSENGPPPLTRFILLVLSTHGDEEGYDIFPSTRTIAVETGHCRRTVEAHLREAERAGWIHRDRVGQGQGWKRVRYTLTIGRGAAGAPPSPGNVEQLVPHVEPESGAAGARRGASDDTNVEHRVPLTSSVPLKETSSVQKQQLSASPGEEQQNDLADLRDRLLAAAREQQRSDGRGRRAFLRLVGPRLLPDDMDPDAGRELLEAAWAERWGEQESAETPEPAAVTE